MPTCRMPVPCSCAPGYPLVQPPSMYGRNSAGLTPGARPDARTGSRSVLTRQPIALWPWAPSGLNCRFIEPLQFPSRRSHFACRPIFSLVSPATCGLRLSAARFTCGWMCRPVYRAAVGRQAGRHRRCLERQLRSGLLCARAGTRATAPFPAPLPPLMWHPSFAALRRGFS